MKVLCISICLLYPRTLEKVLTVMFQEAEPRDGERIRSESIINRDNGISSDFIAEVNV